MEFIINQTGRQPEMIGHGFKSIVAINRPSLHRLGNVRAERVVKTGKAGFSEGVFGPDFAVLVASANDQRIAIGLNDLVQLTNPYFELAPISNVVIRRSAHPIEFRVIDWWREWRDHIKINVLIAHMLIVDQPSTQQQGMNAGRPFAMVGSNGNRFLELVEIEIGANGCLIGIEVLKIVPGMIILVFRQEKERILRRELELELAVPFGSAELIVGTYAFVALPIQIQRITEPA